MLTGAVGEPGDKFRERDWSLEADYEVGAVDDVELHAMGLRAIWDGRGYFKGFGIAKGPTGKARRQFFETLYPSRT
jgi:hypothetical protein